jgi:hypothetical protein
VISIGDATAGLRLLAQLPSFLRRPVAVEEARSVLRRRLEQRDSDFLALAKRAIYDHRRSPYRELLRSVGCEYGDLARLVREDGVDEVLRALCRRGVYLTVDEFKGRRPVRRGSTVIDVQPHDLWNPLTRAHVVGQTTGSRGARTTVPIDLAWIRDEAVNECLDADARGGRSWAHGRWMIPGGGNLVFMLLFSVAGTPPVRWFSPVDPNSRDLHPRYRWATSLLRWGGRLAGVPLPLPEHVPFEDPTPILRWLGDARRSGASPYLVAYTSSIIRVCRAAREAGVDLSGVRALATGEPLTATRLATIRATGLSATPIYASVDTGIIGKGCLAPSASDEVHLFQDLLAAIQPPLDTERSGLSAHALLVSSLRDTTPLVLLNVSLGDQGIVSERRCGCPLERLGWTTHLSTIRSFEKLTAGGMTFLDSDLVHVIEEVLPARFGGTGADYQLVESERVGGFPALRLLVHPRVGLVPPESVVEAFLSAIANGSDTRRIMGMMWRDARLLAVERRAPLMTPSGKILHLHVEGGTAAGAPGGPDRLPTVGQGARGSS